MRMFKHSQRSQIASLQCLYFKKEVKDNVDFLYANKHQSSPQGDFNMGIKSFLQGDTIIIMGMIKHSESTQSNIISKKKLQVEFIFCMQININVSMG